MRRLITLMLSALVLASMAVAPLAHAENSTMETDFNATANMTLANPGQFFSDPAGNRYYQGLVYTGQLTGWPVTGTLRIDANVSFEAGSTTGQIDGNYVISDNSGNTFHGDLAETRVQESANGLLVTARLNVEGGTGIFNDAQGSARIAGNLPTLGVSTTAFTPAFSQPAFGQPYAYGPWAPGQMGFGAVPNAANPWQVNPSQPTLAISGTLALNDPSNLGSIFNQNQNQNNPFNFRDRDAQQQFQNAIRDFFNVTTNNTNNVNTNNQNVRPGNGFGDRNHEHANSNNNDDDNRRGNSNGRGNGRGHNKD